MRQFKVFFLVFVVLSLVAGAMGAASIGVPRLAGATAIISSPASGALFETNTLISFDGSRSTGSQGHNTTNPIVSWEWTFGDGSNASGSTVNHAYGKAGVLLATLIVTDTANATGIASIVLYLAPPASPQKLPNQPVGGGAFNPASGGAMVLSLAGPFAVISSPANNALFELGTVVFFDGSNSTGTSSPNGSYPLVSWEWALGDGTNASTARVNHSYAMAGGYRVTLTVMDSQGVMAMATVAVYLSPPARPQNLPSQPKGGGGFNPVSGGVFILSLGGATAVIFPPANGALFEIGENITFDGSRSTGSSFQNTSYPIVAWNWSFGDGGIGAGTSIPHSYSAAGSYTVTLTVTDSNGASALTTIKIVISPPPTPQNIPSQPAGGSNFNPALGNMGLV